VLSCFSRISSRLLFTDLKRTIFSMIWSFDRFFFIYPQKLQN